MSNEFDAGKEAERINQLAKDAIDESRPMHQSQAIRALEQEYLSLTQPQRNAVALELENQDSWHSTLPTPQVGIDCKGNVSSILFERSPWDVHKSGNEKVVVAEDCVAYGDADYLPVNFDIPAQIKAATHEAEWVEIPPTAGIYPANATHLSKKSHRHAH